MILTFDAPGGHLRTRVDYRECFIVYLITKGLDEVTWVENQSHSQPTKIYIFY